MATLSVLNFCTLSHVHSTPKWILEMTHISSSLIRSGKKPVNFRSFPFLFDKIYENTTKLCKKNSQIFMKNSQKFTCHGFSPHFLSKKKKYGSFQESTFVCCGHDLGHEKGPVQLWPVAPILSIGDFCIITI